MKLNEVKEKPCTKSESELFHPLLSAIIKKKAKRNKDREIAEKNERIRKA